MQNFKFSISKESKNYSVLIKAEHEMEARDKLHKEGFSILSCEVLEENINLVGEKFYYEAEYKGEFKKGAIIGKDIFQVYQKLVDGFGYEMKALYTEEHNTKEQRDAILGELKNQYELFQIHYGNSKEKEKAKIEIKKQEEANKDDQADSFVAKKQIDEGRRIMDIILVKIDVLRQNENLEDYKKQKLFEISTTLKLLKSTTNLTKVKTVTEAVLNKIGEIELELIEKKKIENSENILKETNALLRKVGSNKKFIESEKDVNLKVKTFFKNVILAAEEKAGNKTKVVKKEIDTNNFTYLKNKVLLSKYQKKYKMINNEIMRKFLLFIIPTKNNREIVDFLLGKQRVIKQNIDLLEMKVQTKNFSYSQVSKGYHKLTKKIIIFLDSINKYIFVFKNILLVMIILFIISNYFINSNLKLNNFGIFIFVIINLLYLFIKKIKGLVTLIFYSCLLFALFIFYSVNL